MPELGLKRQTDEKLVVAPYATLLAVGFAPLETMRNLRRLAALGLLSGHGYYDAIDFSRQPGRAGGKGVIVQAYMAHHQGMGLLSLANFLLDGAMRRRFHADGRVRSVEPLLHERVPALPSLHHISTREGAQGADSVGGVAPSTSTFDTAHTRTPKTQLLSNGSYSVMLTNAGGGYSQWGAQEITRWRSDPTRDSVGNLVLPARRRVGRNMVCAVSALRRRRRILFRLLCPGPRRVHSASTGESTSRPRSSCPRKTTWRSAGSR